MELTFDDNTNFIVLVPWRYRYRTFLKSKPGASDGIGIVFASYEIRCDKSTCAQQIP
jgi:hypothetical protein